MTRRNKLKLYILDGKTPVEIDDLLEWAKKFEFDLQIRRVALTEEGKWRVSTVFLGIDHNYSMNGPPLLFETMVFRGKEDFDQQRYATWEQAEQGHAHMCKKFNLTESVQVEHNQCEKN